MNRIEEIRKRLEAATPGKWEPAIYCAKELIIPELGLPSNEDLAISSGPCAQQKQACEDAILIANAPEDLGFLLSLVESKEQKLKIARDFLKDAICECYQWIDAEGNDGHKECRACKVFKSLSDQPQLVRDLHGYFSDPSAASRGDDK